VLQWIADNQQLLIAIFGTGGAGAVLLTTVLKRRRSGGSASQGGTSATASESGIAVANSGTGNVEIVQNETVGEAEIQSLNDQLHLTLTESARMLKAMQAAELPAADLDSIIAKLTSDQAQTGDLIAHLRADNMADAATMLRDLHQSDNPV